MCVFYYLDTFSSPFFGYYVREWRKSGGVQIGISPNQVVHDRLPSPAVSASRKKQKVLPSAHQSFGGSSPVFHSQPPTSNPQSSSAAKRGPSIGPKGKKQNSVSQIQIFNFFHFQMHSVLLIQLNCSTKSLQFPPSAGRGLNAIRCSSDVLANATEPTGVKSDSLIGKKVKTRWPDDNNFYEAVITDFDPAQVTYSW